MKTPLFKLLSFSLFVFIVISFNSCTKDDPEGEGRFSAYYSCTVVSPPTEVNLSSYYTKYLNCSGIPVVGSSAISDEALFLADSTVEFMLQGQNAIRQELIEHGEYIILYPPGGSIDDVPEYMNAGQQSFAGVYDFGKHCLASPMANLLCYPGPLNGNVNDNVLVHELAHMIQFAGIEQINSGFRSQLNSAYNSAMGNGLWNNTYSEANAIEYFAVGVQVWFNVRYPYGPPQGDGSGNDIIKRTRLQNYDVPLYNLIAQYFNTSYDVPGCPGTPLDNPAIACENTVTDIDGNIYNVVSIGPQCWIKENLKTTRLNDGTSIPEISDQNLWLTSTGSARCYYDNDVNNLNTYGYLYNWETINSSAGICPNGWHVPTDADWDLLLATLDYSEAGGYMNSASNLWNPPNSFGTNSSGFSAEPGGMRNDFGDYSDKGAQAVFWSASEENNQGRARRIFDNHQSLFDFAMPKTNGAYCRCVRD